MADDVEDMHGDRARLERIAWGAGSTEAEAARARIALADLANTGRSRSAPGNAQRTAPQAAPPSDREAPPQPTTPVASAAGPGRAPEPVSTPTPVPTSMPVPASGEHGRAAPDGIGGDHPVDASGDGQGESGLQDEESATVSRWTRVRRILSTPRARPWLAGGAAAAVVVAFGTGLVVGTAQPQVPASPSVTPSAGTITLEQLLDAPQTYADQLPGSFEAPVSLHTTRLVFTNRSLSGDDAATPWNVWAGVGTDRSTICLVATADRLQATTACYPREDALHGSVSLSASSLSGTLTVNLSGGGVQGTVTNEF